MSLMGRPDGECRWPLPRLAAWLRPAVLLLAAAAAQADPCAGVPPPEPTALAADADVLRRNQPPAALARACHHWAQQATLPARLELARALAAASRHDAAAALLQPPLAGEATLAPQAAAELALARGTLLLDQGEARQAGPHFDDARRLLLAAGVRGRLPAQALIGQASVLQTLRENADALPRAQALLAEAAAELDAAGLAASRDMGDLLNQRTMVAYARQDLPSAIDHARAEVALVRRLDGPDTPDAFDALASLGAMLSQLGRHDEALQALNDGQRLMALHPEVSPGAQLGILNNLAALKLDRGLFDESLGHAEQSLALAERAFAGKGTMKIVAMSHRAQALMSLSRLAEAQARYEEALALARATPAVPPLRRLRLLDNLADLYTRLNDLPAAQAALAEGLALTTLDAHFGYWRGRLLRQQATLAGAAGRWAEVDALHAQAAPLIAATIGALHPFAEISTVQRCIAQVHGRLPGTACAELAAREATLAEATALHRFRVHHALALADDAAGRGDSARRHHLHALSAAQTAATAHPLWVAFDALAQHLRRHGERAFAVALGKAAVEQVESMRRQFAPAARDSERHFIADKHAVYRRLADWLAEDGRIDEALDVLRLLKAEELLDFVRRAGAAEQATTGPPLTPRESRWRESWPEARPAPAAAGTPAADAQATREAARVAAWNALILQAAASGAAHDTAADRAADRRATAVRRGELQAWLFAGPAHLNLVLQDHRGRRALRLPLAPQELSRRVGQVLAQIGRHEDVLPALQALHADLAAPIVQAAAASGARRLVLHLDGALRYLPFAALHDGRRHLGERFAIEQRITTAPGVTVPVPPQPPALPRSPPAPPFVHAFGVTRALAGLPALPAVAGELCGIVDGEVSGLDPADTPCGRGALPGRGWLNEGFTTTQLRTAAAAPGPTRRALLHLGTHFVLRPGHIGRSWLLTGDAQRLTLDELATLDLRRQALVTLSACETALGGAEGGDGREIDGLAAVLARRGAGAVVASLWRVDDRSTAALMHVLYRELARHGDPARALQAAQQAVRGRPGGDWGHPFHWAAFTVSIAASDPSAH